MLSSIQRPVTTVDTEPHYDVGSWYQDVNGNIFAYTKGVASCAAGSVVTIDETGQLALLAANAKGRVGVAMGAFIADTYGFVQIYGKNLITKVAANFADNGNVYATATPGTVDDAVVAGDRVKGMWGRSAVASGVATMELNLPFVDDIND